MKVIIIKCRVRVGLAFQLDQLCRLEKSEKKKVKCKTRTSVTYICFAKDAEGRKKFHSSFISKNNNNN